MGFLLVVLKTLCKTEKYILIMWLNDMVAQNMFIEKVRDQKKELEATRNRNAELQKKHQHLEQEQTKLNELVKSNQVDVVTKKNNLNALLADLKDQTRSNLTAAQRLEICKEQIHIIQQNIEETNDVTFGSLTDLAPIREKLSFKWDVVECLQRKLVETRLQAAEKEAVATELKLCEIGLENEIELLENSKRETLPVSHLQEQFLSARIREADVVLEFDKLKRTLAIIKHELEEKKIETELEISRENEESFHIHFNLRDKYHDQIKLLEDASVAETVELQNEIDYLRMQVKKLDEIKQDIVGRVHFNEEVKVHLHEVKTSIFLRLQKTNEELENIIEKNKKLEDKMTRNLHQIQNNMDDKDIQILQLDREIKNLHIYNENCAKSNDQSMASMNEDTINRLQEEIEMLEAEIKLFKEK